MKTLFQLSSKVALGVSAALLIGALAAAEAQTPATNQVVVPQPAAAAEPGAEPVNWITTGIGGVFTSGDQTQFQERWGMRRGLIGGLQDFHYELMFGKKGMLELDGNAMYGGEDYSVRLKAADPDRGFIRGGYHQFRRWYDGSGGYFPGTGTRITLYDENYAVERGEFWIEGGLTPPDGPMLTLKYVHSYRKGTKDSLIWGDSTQGGAVRGMVPSFRELNESRNRIEADVKHALGKSDFGLGVRLDLVDNNNALKERRRPGEGASRFVTQREVFESDMLNLRAFTETRLTDAVLLTTGYSYTRLNTDVGGSRIYGASFDAPYLPAYPGRQARDEGYVNLSGGSLVDQYVMNLSLRFEPVESLVIVPSLRAEKLDTSGNTTFTENTTGGASPFPASSALMMNSRQRGFTTITEAIEARYTGVTNWVFYTRGEWSQGDGYLRELELDLTAGGPPGVSRSTDSERFTQKYTIGVNWYPLRRLHFAAQYYHKTRENNYFHLTDSTSNTAGADRYPAYLRENAFQTDDFNLRATWRPRPNVTLVTRYDFQISTIETTAGSLPGVESARTTAHIISQTLTWVPWSRLFVQGGFNYALDATTTPPRSQTGAVPGLLPDARNDYWQASTMVTLVLNEKTDVQGSYFYYRANNFINSSGISMPYGTSAQDHSVNASLIRNFSKTVRGSLSYGYYAHRDETSGGLDNYDAHLVFSTLTYRF
ncbi:MAG: hypothetical protein B9S33_03445 [Pedosphaera sp. Tous-C6FEB]|nr:MAG: hypothetical protein B9S33_03445 [Pedosphaera sp. Tous-C6FEB]